MKMPIFLPHPVALKDDVFLLRHRLVCRRGGRHGLWTRVASTVYILVGVGGSLGKQRGFGGDEILQHQLIGPVVYTSHDFVGGYPMIFRVSTMIYRVITPINMVYR